MSDNKMQSEFEASEFYSCGESQIDRAANWYVWVAAWKAALAQQASKPEQKTVAHEILSDGRTQRLIVREDVAQEYADKLNAQDYKNVEVRELVYRAQPKEPAK